MNRGFTLIDPRSSACAEDRLRGNDITELDQGFTLIELLVVIAIIAILAVVVVLTLSPGQLIMQGRDSGRISDMASLQSAIGYYLTDSGINGGTNLGSSSVVYVSIPDMTATTTAGTNCASVGLPTLPSGYTYHCAASSTFRSVNGTGWIPVNLSGITQGSPFGSWPVDPLNQTTTRNYYTYTTNGSQFELTAAMESQKYKLGGTNDVIGPDGATLATIYVKGTSLTLEPLDYGDSSLIGYWPLTEGSGTIAYDDSGSNATGSWAGGSAYTTGKIGPYAASFSGSNYISIGTGALTTPTSTFTVSAWVAPSSAALSPTQGSGFIGNSQYLTGGFQLGWYTGSPVTFGFDVEPGGQPTVSSPSYFSAGNWTFVVGRFTGGVGTIFINGVQVAQTTGLTEGADPSNLFLGKSSQGGWTSPQFSGSIDDVRVYSRALSPSEIQAMYNGGK